MQNLIRQCIQTEYSSWKKQHSHVIKQLRDYLLNIPENEISSFYNYLENEIKNLIDSNQPADIMQSLYCCSILYHFQRSHDIVNQYYLSFASKFVTNDRVIINCIAKTFYWLAEDSNETIPAFREILNFAKKSISEYNNIDDIQNNKSSVKINLENGKYLYNALIVFKTIRKFMKPELIQIISNNFNKLILISSSSDFQCQKLAIKLITFQFSNVPDEIINKKIPFMEQKYSELFSSNEPHKIFCAIKFMELLIGCKNFKTYPNINEILDKSQSQQTHIIEAVINLSIQIHQKYYKNSTKTFDANKLFKIVCQNFSKLKNPMGTLNHIIDTFKGMFDLNILTDFLENYSLTDHECNSSNSKVLCPFHIYKDILQKCPSLNARFNKNNNFKNPCKHFFKCAIKKKELFTKEIREYFFAHFQTDDLEFYKLLILYPEFLELFPSNINDFIDQLNVALIQSNEVRLRKRILKTLSFIKNKKAQDIIHISSLVDPSEDIRLLSMNFLEITPYLASTNMIQYLNDSSFAVRKQGIKIISQLYQYNTFELQPLILEYIQNILELLITSTNVKDSSNYASFLATFTKHFNDISDFIGYNILSVVLKVVNSSITDQERNLIYDIQIDQRVEKKNDDESLPNETPETNSSFDVSNSINNSSTKNLSPSSFNSPPSPVFPSLESMNNFFALDQDSESISDLSVISHINEKFMSKYSLDIIKMPALLLNERKSMKEPNRSKLFLIFHSKSIDKRDSFLLKAISNLGSLCYPCLNDILLTYSKIFETRTNEKLLISAVKSLTNLSLSLYNGLNIRLRCPQMVQPLTHILSTTSNEKLAISIIQLFGSAFDSVDILQTKGTTTSTSSTSGLSAVMTHSKSFYTDLSITNVLKYMGEPCLATLRTLTNIVEGDPMYSAKYLPKIISVFTHMIKKGSIMIKDHAFRYLEVIASNCIKDFVPLLPITLPLLSSHLHLESCARFSTLLSYFMKTDFIFCANELYFPSISHLKNAELGCYRSLVNFISSMIIYQHLPFDVFLRSLENLNITAKMVLPTFNALTSILQSIDISFYSSRLFIFAVNIRRTHTVDLSNFFATLCLFGNSSVGLLKKYSEVNKLNYKYFDELEKATKLAHETHVIPKVKFIKEVKIKYSIPRSFLRLQTNHYFNDIDYPNELHINIWIKNLLKVMITRSPSSSIRACSDFLNFRMRFISKLFPVAFLSCWKNANEADRDHFSAIVDYAIHSHKKVNQVFFDVIQMADKSLIPMKIDLKRVAEISISHQDTFFLIQKQYLNNPYDKEIMRVMIDSCIKLGRLATARGLLQKSENYMDKIDIAKWSGELGDWDKAFTIYKAQKAELPLILTCLESMSKFDEILHYENQFNNLAFDEKLKVMDHFLWAFHLKQETNKVENIIGMFDNNWTMFRVIFTIYLKITTEEYEKAQDLIDLGYKILATHKDEYLTGDQTQIENDQDMAELLVESQEVLNYKMMKSGTEKTTSFFTRRIKFFKRSRFIWERTICLRQIVVPIKTNLDFYLKIIAELRKSHTFSLISIYFEKYMKFSENPRFLVEGIKTLWVYGFKQDALETCQKISLGINSTKESDFVSIAKNLPKYFASNFLAKIVRTNSFSLDMKNSLSQSVHKNSIEEFWSYFKNLTSKEQNDIYMNFANDHLTETARCLREVFLNDSKNNHFVASINRLAGNYLKSLNPDNIESLDQAARYYKVSLDTEPENLKIWRCWGIINAKLYTKYSPLKTDNENDKPRNEIINKYSKRAMKSFLKLCRLQQNESLEYASQLFSILSTCDVKISQYFASDIIDLPPLIIIKVLPILTSKIDHPNPFVRNIISNILTNAGIHYFQEIYFALNLYSASENLVSTNKNDKKVIADQILSKIIESHPNETNDINIFIDGMVCAALSWFEKWMYSLEFAVKERGSNVYREILQKCFTDFEHPRCELDFLFVRLYQEIIHSCKSHFYKNDETSINLMWAKLKSLYASLKDRVNKLSIVFLSKVSNELATKRNFAVFAPGYNDCTIESIEPIMDVLETQQHPRIVNINTNKGKRYKYLLKGNEDLRLDERLMQLFALINGIMMHSSKTKENKECLISRYAVIPMTNRVGLIKWVSGADTFHQLIMESRELTNINKDGENEIIKENIDNSFIQLNHLQRFEIFQEIDKKMKAREIFEMIWLRAPNSAVWLNRTQNFTISYALMAMVGYIIGLGDRHPSNIMVQRDTGKIVHIDFGESFDSTIMRQQYPEKVPFRLTRMVANALEGSIIQGLFTEFATTVMQVLRDSRETLISQLTIFAEEPLSNSKRKYSNDSLIKRCFKKLSGVKLVGEFAIREMDYRIENENETETENEKPIPVKDQVSFLINVASDPANYIKHYPGWCPFW
ncbi:hypothetical protein TRFO_19582 [Tritrichomonas foetus]|uniref:non-specific serine/threonine protein kinase n=1 Tax=Tritrichomonas foetus TaxID=1144522 RepID=A0A1J4KMJ4_9EUKA|nr:hypothetical protein TRFO_19582 [Tritrichomonas foetus]|eukprot:OHT10910.1 hypothetical protein TRFO_19582 [Tritrichomonas foetus]